MCWENNTGHLDIAESTRSQNVEVLFVNVTLAIFQIYIVASYY